MLDVDDLTTEELLRAWRDAEIEANGTAIDTAEHAAALQRSEKAREAYQFRLETMKDDLRDD
jgi:phage anti-repressor protein